MQYNYQPEGRTCHIRTRTQKYIGYVQVKENEVIAQPIDGVMWLPVMEALEAIEMQQAMSNIEKEYK